MRTDRRRDGATEAMGTARKGKTGKKDHEGRAGTLGGMTVARNLLLGFALLLAPWTVRAQGVEAVGIRALGMGGAFVGVADDASATYWNPAGLVTGPLGSAVAEFGRGDVELVPASGADPGAWLGSASRSGTPWPSGPGLSGRRSTASPRHRHG